MNSYSHPSKHITVMHKPVGLIERVREVIRYKHYSLRTEQAYVQWIRRFVAFGVSNQQSAAVLQFLGQRFAGENLFCR